MTTNKPTRDQFAGYVNIRNSGITNMFDVRSITSISATGLDKGICLYIMEHFAELSEEYGVET